MEHRRSVPPGSTTPGVEMWFAQRLADTSKSTEVCSPADTSRVWVVEGVGRQKIVRRKMAYRPFQRGPRGLKINYIFHIKIKLIIGNGKIETLKGNSKYVKNKSTY